MSSREPVVSIAVLREALRQRVEESSLRIAAREVGLSWKGIDKLLAGAEPHAATRRKLTDWYLRRTAGSDEVPTLETVQVALGLIVRHLPPAHRQQALLAAGEAVRQIGEQMGVPAPEWLEALRSDN